MNNIDIRRIDLNLLVVFEAVYREGTVTRASEKLHLTQSSVSHALARLRKLFDDPLFLRHHNGMTPTVLARELYPPVLAALRILEDTLNQPPADGQTQPRRVLNIGLITTDEAAFLPQLMARQGNAPRYEIVTSLYEPGRFESRLASGKFDAVMQPFAYSYPSAQVQSCLLGREGLSVMIRRNHPALRKGALDLDTYLGLRHIVVAPRRMETNYLDMEFARRRLEREVVLRCQDYWTAARIVAETDCILTAPHRPMAYLIGDMRANKLVPLPEGLNMPDGADIYLYWHAAAEDDPDNRWLRQNLVEIFQAP
ncbi:MAG: LysR family transcriptional regulator [Sterolibacterium sp.]|nr:LysR family transcriptional regulator [Sterolibacterium sp.]